MEKIKRVASIKYCLLHGIYWMCFCLLFSFSSIYLLGKGFSNRQIGAILAIGGIIAVVCQSKVGELADRSDKITLRHIIVILSSLSIIIAIFSLIFGNSIFAIRLFYIGMVVLLQIIMPLLNAVGMEFVNSGIPLNFGLARGIGSLSFSILALFIGSYLEGRNPNLIMIVGIALYTLLLLVALSFKIPKNIPTNCHNIDKNDEEFRISLENQNKSGQISKTAFGFLLFGIVLIFSSHIVINNFLFQITNWIGGTSSQMGIAMAICAFVELPTMYAYNFVSKKISTSSLIKLSALFFALKTLCTLLCKNMELLYLVQLMQIFGFAIFTPSSVYFVNSVSSDGSKARAQALLGGAITLGGVLGNYFGGLIIELSGVKMALISFSIIAFIGAGIIFSSARESYNS